MAANVMEKSFLRRGMPTILWQERIFFFARHGARGEEEEAVTLIHNSHPSLDFLPVLWASLPCWPVIENTSGHQPSYFITYQLLVIDFFN